jgi:hypothetical protein
VINGHHSTEPSPPDYVRRRKTFAEAMERQRERLPFIDDPVARTMMADMIDALEELLGV